MTTALTIAGIQCDVAFADASANFALMRRHVEELRDQKLFLIAFPECFLQGYCFQSQAEALEHALPRDAPLLRQIRDLAVRCDTHLVFGFLELADGRVFNSCGMATRQGNLHVYRKVHLPMLGVDRFATAGDRLEVFSVDGVNIGLNICYDCSFPEPARLLALQGADLIVLPTNWPPGAGCTCDFVPNTRALENHIYYMAINRVGSERGFAFVGKSRICDPEGRDLARALHDRPEVLIAGIDPAIARRKHLVRVPGKHEIHRFADRRPELYADLAANIRLDRN
jgi:predicted amidohydrolase